MQLPGGLDFGSENVLTAEGTKIFNDAHVHPNQMAPSRPEGP